MADKSGDKTRPPKIPQPNGGALYAGGVPGNKGGTGRPTNLARLAAAEGVLSGVPKMRELIEHAKDDSNKIKAFEALAKLMPQQIGEDPDAPFQSPEDRLAKLKALLAQR